MDTLSILAALLLLASLVSIFAFWKWWGRAKWVYFIVLGVLLLTLYQHINSLHL